MSLDQTPFKKVKSEVRAYENEIWPLYHSQISQEQDNFDEAISSHWRISFSDGDHQLQVHQELWKFL